MKPEELLEKLRANARFPRHGWAVDSDNWTYLVFPILRATWERSPLEPMPSSVSVQDFLRMGYFQRLFLRILQILGEIARAERLILSAGDRDGAPIEEWAPVSKARQLLPIWLDCFYVYFRILADRLTVNLAPLVSTTPNSFPREYKKLLNEAESPSKKRLDWHFRLDADEFLLAIRENSSWYRTLVRPYTERTGIRDSIVHQLADGKVIVVLDRLTKKKESIQIRFDSSPNVKVAEIDAFSAIGSVLRGFCDCLSAFPQDLWLERNFHISDVSFRADGDWPAVTRFFPRLF